MSTQTDPEILREQLASIAHDRWTHWAQGMLSVIYPELFDGSQAEIPSETVKRWITLIRTPYELLDPDDRAAARLHADEMIQAFRDASRPQTPPVILVRDNLPTIERWHVSKDRDGLQVHCGRPIPGAPLVIREGESSRAHHNVCVVCIEKMLDQ